MLAFASADVSNVDDRCRRFADRTDSCSHRSRFLAWWLESLQVTSSIFSDPSTIDDSKLIKRLEGHIDFGVHFNGFAVKLIRLVSP